MILWVSVENRGLRSDPGTLFCEQRVVLGDSRGAAKIPLHLPQFTRGMQECGASGGLKSRSRWCQSRHRQQFRRKRNSPTDGNTTSTDR